MEGVSVIRTVERKPMAFATSQAEEGRLWHRRFGHASCETLAKMAQDSLVEGLPSAASPQESRRNPVRRLCPGESKPGNPSTPATVRARTPSIYPHGSLRSDANEVSRGRTVCRHVH